MTLLLSNLSFWMRVSWDQTSRSFLIDLEVRLKNVKRKLKKLMKPEIKLYKSFKGLLTRQYLKLKNRSMKFYPLDEWNSHRCLKTKMNLSKTMRTWNWLHQWHQTYIPLIVKNILNSRSVASTLMIDILLVLNTTNGVLILSSAMVKSLNCQMKVMNGKMIDYQKVHE